MEKNVINVSEFKTAYDNLNCVLGEVLVLSDDYLLDCKNVQQANEVNEKIMNLAKEIELKIEEMEQIAMDNDIVLDDVED